MSPTIRATLALASLLALPLAACGSDSPSSTDADKDLDTVASTAACDAVAISCCGRGETMATCLPAQGAEPERWRCGDELLGTAGYAAACRDANPASCPTSPPSRGDACPRNAVEDVCWYTQWDYSVPLARTFCTCTSFGWDCVAPTDAVYACVVPEAPVRPVTAALPARALAPTEACADPADEPRDASCVPGQQDDGRFCATHADCGAPDTLCLDSHTFGAGSACTCTPSSCLTNDDCPTGMLCQCGEVDASRRCGGWTGRPCGHHCVIADCRSDADCAPGGRCAASYGVCGWQVERYACRYPDRDGCWTDDECGAHATCRYFAEAATWCCQQTPLCD